MIPPRRPGPEAGPRSEAGSGSEAPRRRLNIHIGHYKTGTTALQIHLARHAAALRRRRRLDYAAPWLTNAKHSIFAFSLYRAEGVKTLMHGYAKPDAPEDLWRALFEHVRAAPAREVLISSEEFMRLGEFPGAERRLARILEGAGGDVALRVIAYLRPPGAHLASWHNQMVKMRQRVPDFDRAAAETVEAVHYDYAAAIAPWSRLVGPENVELHAYRRDPGDPDALPRHFLGLFGLEGPERGEGAQDVNPRLDDRLVELVRLLQNAGLPRAAVQTFIAQAGAVAEEMDDPGPPPDFAAVTARAGRGLAALPELGRMHFDPAELAADLPAARGRPAPGPTDLALQVLATEFLKLRRRVNQAGLDETPERLAALESRLAALEAKPGRR